MMPFRFEDSLLLIGRNPADQTSSAQTRFRHEPDWVQASPPKIRRSLQRASAQTTGGWAVLGGSRDFQTPQKRVVAGEELVLWRNSTGELRAAPNACPHMGAPLCEGRVDAQGRIVCPWHALALGAEAHGRWKPVTAHDDGVLVWVRHPALLAPGEVPTDAPLLPVRPTRFLDAVIQVEATCEPEDVIANRLDPWHGAHFHPHSFARLRVVDETPSSITVRVVYRIAGPLGMEVDARFDCPDARTIVMTIVGGDGIGSLVETHATPMSHDRTLITEATLAASDRLPWLPKATLLRSAIAARASRLWEDDARYCERTFALRQEGIAPLIEVRRSERSP